MLEETVLTGVCCINIIISLFNLYLLPTQILDLIKKIRRYHFNVWLILIQLHLACINFILTALFLSSSTLINPNSFNAPTNFQQVSLYFGSYSSGFFLISMLVVFIERLLATWCYKVYENFNNKCLILFIFIGCFLIAAGNSYIWNANTNIDKGALRYTFLGFQIFSTICIFILLEKNRRLYLLKFNSVIVLSHRYQLHENIHTLKEIFPFVLCGNFGLILAMIASVLSYQFLPTFMTGKAPPNCYYFGILNFCVFLCFIFIRFENNNYLSISNLCNGLASRKRISNSIMPQKHLEADEYFNQLKNVW